MRATRLAAVVLTLGLATLGAAVPASANPAQDNEGGIGLRLLDAPVSAKDDPRARVYIVDHLAPGSSIERRVEVTNTTDRDQSIALYAGAASIDEGTFLGAPGRELNDLASWTTVTPAATTAAAGGTQLGTVTIEVPADAAPGEQYGVVWAEARSTPTDDGGVVQVSRVGIRLYVSVGPGGAPAADFEVETLTAGRSVDGDPVVTARVRNTGGRALDMTGSLELTGGPGGLTAGPFPAELGSTLAVGAVGTVRITLDPLLPDGPWQAVVELGSGLVERRAEATITFPAAGEATAAVAVTGNGPTRPWLAVLVAGALLALLVAVRSWVRGRRVARGRPRSRPGRAAG